MSVDRRPVFGPGSEGGTPQPVRPGPSYPTGPIEGVDPI